jgi:Fic family protein
MKPYIPEKLPVKHLNLGNLVGLIGKANADLARYDGLLQGLVNPGILLSPLTTQEAVLSSKIEGTVATLDEVLELEAGRKYDEKKTQDIQEIVNYRQVLLLATDQLVDRPLTLGFIKQMHELLMNSVRGQNKSPGEFRKDQNWIGRPGSPIEKATFVPPGPLKLMDYLEAWERYVHEEDIDPLVQASIIHAQFELIHPFKEGNGRIGRLLNPLFLYCRGVLSSPMFYLSAYLEAHRSEYYGCLLAISRERDWEGWIRFFLEATCTQSRDNTERVKKVLSLYEEMKETIRQVTHSQYSMQALDAIFARPVFQTSDFIERSAIPKQTAMPLLRRLRETGILEALRESSGRRPAILAFPALLNIAEGKRVI